jgi:hypothetical protein
VRDEYLTVFVLCRTAVAHEDVKPLLLSQHGRSRTALSRSKYHNSLFHSLSIFSAALTGAFSVKSSMLRGQLIFYRIFSVTTLSTARMMATIQKRVTIFGSAYPFF